MYKIVGQCGDGGKRLERKSRGQSRLEESCEGSQTPPRAVVLLLLLMMMITTTTTTTSTN
jgi:hypothetical protein